MLLSVCSCMSTQINDGILSDSSDDASTSNIIDEIVSDITDNILDPQEYILGMLFENSSYTLEYFAQELLFNELSLTYDVFSAEIVLADGSVFEGFGFSDHSEMYESNTGEEIYFLAGFVPIGEVVS